VLVEHGQHFDGMLRSSVRHVVLLAIRNTTAAQ
jgi:hypothetical protein